MNRSLELRPLGSTGIQVTFLGYGALEIGRDWGYGDPQRPDEASAAETLHAVIDLGINIIDTAAAYHQSEIRIGNAISKRRSNYFLASKCGEHNSEPSTYYDFSYDAVAASINRSLENLQTDQIDLMQIHFGPDPHEVLHRGETVQAMLDAKSTGKIRFLGASAWNDVGWRCLEMGVFDVLQLDYHLLNQNDEALIHACHGRKIGVLIRTGLGRGIYSDKMYNGLSALPMEWQQKLEKIISVTRNDTRLLRQIALRFLYENRSISSVLLGSKNMMHIRDNLDLLNSELDSTVYQNVLEILQ